MAAPTRRSGGFEDPIGDRGVANAAIFGGGKLVWLKNANCLGDSVIGRSASVQSALDDLAELLDAGLGSDVTFLLSATEVDKRRSFYKTLGKRAELQVIDGLDSSRAGWEEEATEISRRRAKARGLQFDEESARSFCAPDGRRHPTNRERIGKNRPVIWATIAGVLVRQVRELVPLSRAGVIFELGMRSPPAISNAPSRLVKRLLDQVKRQWGFYSSRSFRPSGICCSPKT